MKPERDAIGDKRIVRGVLLRPDRGFAFQLLPNTLQREVVRNSRPSRSSAASTCANAAALLGRFFIPGGTSPRTVRT